MKLLDSIVVRDGLVIRDYIVGRDRVRNARRCQEYCVVGQRVLWRSGTIVALSPSGASCAGFSILTGDKSVLALVPELQYGDGGWRRICRSRGRGEEYYQFSGKAYMRY